MANTRLTTLTMACAPSRVSSAMLLAGAWGGGIHCHPLAPGLLMVAPCFALAVVVLLGHYPGAEALCAWRSEPRGNHANGHAVIRLRWAWPPHETAAGGLLLARRLAARAPPLPLVTNA
jgi:hypothetical protein